MLDMSELSEDDDIAAAQALSMGATRYAGAVITAAIGTPPPGSSALEALSSTLEELIRARKTVDDTAHLPAPVRSALCDRQRCQRRHAGRRPRDDDIPGH